MDFLSIDELKRLDIDSASEYCNSLRKYIIETLNVSGGHLASNLGVVEISVALIRAFDSPKDKIIYDVGHQSYVHKLLTGRVFDSETLRRFNGFSGFTKRSESDHDSFGAGHSSTALSAALGFSRASTINGDNNYSVAVIGDGAFCTGMTFEALNNIQKSDNLIIILNDNEMSISKNVGTMSSYLNKMRMTKKYFSFKRKTKNAFRKIPFIYKGISAVKRFTKRLLITPTMFDDLGVYYLGPADGNDLETVETLLYEAKARKSPVLIHLVTKKGKGMPEAENNPGKFHFVNPINSQVPKSTFSEEFVNLLTDYSKTNPKSVAITAAMCDGTGLTKFKNEFPERLFDVGISEEHAATFAAALSAGGLMPFYVVYSTFFQRSYDQVIHDIALQDLKVIVALDRAGIVGADGPTHHGVFDVSMMLNVPGTLIYSPATYSELKFSFDICTQHNGLSVLRYPRGGESALVNKSFAEPWDYACDDLKPSAVLFITYGRISEEAIKAKELLAEKGIPSVVMKFLKLKPLNIDEIKATIDKISPSLICFVEEGMKTGGFSEFFSQNVDLSVSSLILAIDEIFVPHGNLQELFDYASLSADKISERVLRCLQKTH